MAKTPQIKINITGIKELNKQLKSLPVEYEKIVMDEINKSALIDFETQAKKNAPVDTGRLRASIHVQKFAGELFTYKDGNGKSYNGGFKEKQKKYEILVGTNVEYAKKQEIARKYLSRALASGKPKLYKRVKTALENITR